jgi:type II secretory pathway pseudopilin PulG
MKKHRVSGFTVVEILIGICLAGLLGSLGVGTYVYVKNNGVDHRVAEEVSELNHTMDAYLLSGAEMPPSATPTEVLSALKAVPSEKLKSESNFGRRVADADLGIQAYRRARAHGATERALCRCYLWSRMETRPLGKHQSHRRFPASRWHEVREGL